MDYLDTNGLLYLLQKMKETFVTRAEWQAAPAQADAPAQAAQAQPAGGAGGGASRA